MGFYKIPIAGADWGSEEVRLVLAALLGARGAGTKQRAELAEFISRKFGRAPILVNSARNGLEVVLRHVAQNRPESSRCEVLVPSLICKTVPDKVLRAGLKLRFVDVGSDMSPRAADFVRVLSPSVAAVIFPYLYGKVVDIAPLTEACKARGIPLIEDCAASFLLSNPQGALTGRGGDYVIFSFSVGKTLVAGAGGALLNHTAETFDAPQAWSTQEEHALARGKVGWLLQYAWKRWGYALQRLGVDLGPKYHLKTLEDYRSISLLDSRLVMTQLGKWERIRKEKQRVLAQYRKNFAAASGIELPQLRSGDYVNRLFASFPERRVVPDEAGKESAVVRFLKGKGIQTQYAYMPAHRRKQFAQFAEGDFPMSERLHRGSVEVPSQGRLTPSEIDFVCECLFQAARLPDEA